MEKPVTFTNCGQQIIGILHIPEDRTQTTLPTIAMLHGFTGNKAESHRLFVHIARSLCQEGYVVLRFDFRGSGDSEGGFEDTTVSQEVSDTIAALDFLKQQSEVDAANIGLIGLSLGGRVAALSALEDSRITFLVLYSAFLNAPPLKSETGQSLVSQKDMDHLHNGEAIHYARGYYIKQAFLHDLHANVPLNLMHTLRIPTLIIHGDQDETVPVTDAHQGYELIQNNHPQNQLHIVRGADHTYTMKEHTQEVLERTKDCLASLR